MSLAVCSGLIDIIIISLNCFLFHLASIVRRVVNLLRQHYKTVEESEAFYGLDVECYMSDVSASASETSEQSLRLHKVLASSMKSLTQKQLEELVMKNLITVRDQKSLLLKVF